jgi:hypothetical protein
MLNGARARVAVVELGPFQSGFNFSVGGNAMEPDRGHVFLF